MYQKEIIYLNLLCNDEKEKNVGFLKIEKKEEVCCLSLQIKNVMSHSNGNFPIRMQTQKGWKEVDTVALQSGSASWEKNVEEEVWRIEIMLSDSYKIVGQSKAIPQPEQPKQEEQIEQTQQAKQSKEVELPMQAPVQKMPEKPVQQCAAEISKQSTAEVQEQCLTESPVQAAAITTAPEKKKRKEVPLYEDKWEQLLTTYEKIHPYGDERTYIKLEPKDFIVLRSNYQHLVNNSFLLHGFYNYRYLILGKEKDFYVGVPGVFYEREKMVALMFGFEAFECEGGMAEEGKFGYYLRKVEL